MHLHGVASRAVSVPEDSSDSANAETSVASARAWTERLFTSIQFWFAVGAFGAAFLAWDSRYFMGLAGPDGLSYLDMASETLRSGPHNLVNLLWSPLYPALIALFLFLFRPSPSLEIPLIHVLNWLIFIAVSLCFTFLLRTCFIKEPDSTADKWNVARYQMLVPFAFWLFFWSIVHFIPVSQVTPDLCVAGIVFLAAGICARLSWATSDWKRYLALGATLALGYYAKAVMFPAALLLLSLLFVWPPSARRSRYRILLAAVVFLLLSAPLITLMSSRVGHLSTGGSGSLNYAWWVNKVPPYGGSIRMEMTILNPLYKGDADGTTGLTHPPRILMERPLILEFGSPIKGTYPLWYDPCYWNEGAKPRFDLRQQLVALKENLLLYGPALIEMSSLCAGALVLCFFAPQKRRVFAHLDRTWYWLLLWAIAVGAMYSCIHVEYRFLGAFFVLFWLAAYRTMLGRLGIRTETAVVATVLCSLIVSTIGSGVLRHHTDHKAPDYLVIANALRRLGVNSGDELATVGYTFDAYYAHAAGTRIIAQIPDADDFWNLSAGDFEKVKECLTSIGVKALVAKDGPHQGDWQEIPGTRLNRVRVLMLQPPTRVSALPRP